MDKLYYTEKDFFEDIHLLSDKIKDKRKNYAGIYGVPKGGIPLASALSVLLKIPVVPFNEIHADILIVDDLIDSGTTRQKFPRNDFACLHLKSLKSSGAKWDTFYHSKTISLYKGINQWIHYWWEGNNETDSIKDNITRIFQYIGENPNREGLLETPERVVKSWSQLYSGYNQNSKDIIKLFDADGHDEMILLKNIELYSMCEHHLLPFIGKAHVAYIPDKKIIGISKLARIVEMYSRRVQIQERICSQVTDLLMDELKPKGAACIIEAQHLCMQMRGVQKQNSVMTTSSLKGIFLKKQEVRKELMDLIK
jgi:GTP cyclohydrolase I